MTCFSILGIAIFRFATSLSSNRAIISGLSRHAPELQRSPAPPLTASTAASARMAISSVFMRGTATASLLEMPPDLQRAGQGSSEAGSPIKRARLDPSLLMKSRIFDALLCAMLSTLVLSSASARSAEFKIGAHTFTLPDGFEIELVAGPPLIPRPINASFDEEGRLYVTDSSGTNDKVEKQLAEKPHRVVRLEDGDGDGRFEKSTVFADKLMFPEGAMWWRGSLYVAAPPSIWKLTDTDGDGIADRREEWFKGGTLTGCANDLHGPYAGPDGWIYWCKGAWAEQRHVLGDGREFKTRAAHIFRSRPDGRGLEPVLTGGMDNPVGIAFTPEGERILSGTFFETPAAGLRDGLIHAIYGGVYGKPHEDVVQGHPRTGDLMPMLAHLGPAAPSGIVRYSARVFGDEFRDNLFLCCFNLHKITRHVLVPNGSTCTTQGSDFLVSDQTDFHPTDILEDADGSLLVVDTGGWYKLCCPTSQLHKPDVLGAIYRIRRSGVPRIEDPRGMKLDIADLAASKAAELLGDERCVVRQRAVARLVDLADAAIPELARILKASQSVESRRHAVWALTQIEAPAARAEVRRVLEDAEASIRHAATQSVSLRRDAEARDRLVAMLEKEDPALQRLAAESLGRIGDKSVVPAILARTGGEMDRVLEHSLIYALIELADREATLAGFASKNPRTQRAALLALEQMSGGGVKSEQVTAHLGAPDKALRDSAWWVAGRHPEWSAEFVGVLKTRLLGADATDPDLVRALAQAASREPIQQLLVATLHDGEAPKSSRLAALRAMTRAGLRKTPQAWFDEILHAFAEADSELASEAVAASRTLTIPKERGEALVAGLVKLGRDSRRPTDLRLAALTAVPPGGVAVDAELFAFLRGLLASGNPPMTRTAAATLLGSAKVNREQALELANALPAASSLEIARLLPAFENVVEESISVKVLEVLETSKAATSVPAERVRAWLAKCPASVQQRGVELLGRLGVDPAKQKTHLDELTAKVKGGDIRRGQGVFNNPKSGCVTCHSVGYVGGNFGPDLTRIGTVRNERDLLEAIVYPSASFARSYEPYVAVTKAGEQMGLLRKDGTDEIVLAPGPGIETRLVRNDVVELRPATISSMPQGYDQILNAQELADLIAFLKATH